MSENISADLIFKYFPNLSEEQRRQFEALDALYHDWNAKINVISRKDIDNLYPHHVLHSLGIAKVINFRPGTSVMDITTALSENQSQNNRRKIPGEYYAFRRTL